jgi:hypothetical protein
MYIILFLNVCLQHTCFCVYDYCCQTGVLPVITPAEKQSIADAQKERLLQRLNNDIDLVNLIFNRVRVLNLLTRLCP